MKEGFSLLIFFISSTWMLAQYVDYRGFMSCLDSVQLSLTELDGLNSNYSQRVKNKFAFTRIKSGHYRRCVQEIGCDTIDLYTDKSNDTIYVPLEDYISLSEVSIRAKRKPFKNVNGVLEVDVKDSPLLTGGSLFETITRLPYVNYNPSTNLFLLKGKANIQVQIDGEILYLSGNDLINYLKGIPAESINKIELNTNPSAKHEASVQGGIINILTKKTDNHGCQYKFTL